MAEASPCGLWPIIEALIGPGNMRIIIVSDIFGLTDELIEFSNQICTDAIILDPYMGKMNPFSDEKEAFSWLASQGYSVQLAQLINRQIKK